MSRILGYITRLKQLWKTIGLLAKSASKTATRVKIRSSIRSRHSATNAFLRRSPCLAARPSARPPWVVRSHEKPPDARSHHENGAFELERGTHRFGGRCFRFELRFAQ